jgi:phenylacetate-CoA ligase
MSPATALAPAYDVEKIIRATLPGQRRHLPRLEGAARDLRRFARRDEDSLRARLQPRFAALAASLWRSPYHLERLRARGLSPRDLRGPEDLPAFPCLDRAVLQEHGDDLVLLSGAQGDLVCDRSSGSTGRPLRVWKDGYDTLHPWAVLRFLTRQLALRLPPQPRVALLCALPHGVEYAVAPPALRGGTLRRISLVRPDPEGRLRAFDPQVLFTDPAGLHWLLATGHPPRPRIVLSSGQHLPKALREKARARLGAPVVNYYSTTETGPLAWECLTRPGRFHVLHPDVWIESVGGEILVTRLRPSALPLLRYRTGDRGKVEPEDCSCGYRGRSLVGLEGRGSCLFITPDGRAVDAWRLAWLFKHEPLTAFGLTQIGPSRFRLELHGARAPGALRVRLAAALRALGWERAQIGIAHHVRLRPATKPEPFRRSLPR